MWKRDQNIKWLVLDDFIVGKDRGLVVNVTWQVKTQPGKFYHEPNIGFGERRKAKDWSQQQRNNA